MPRFLSALVVLFAFTASVSAETPSLRDWAKSIQTRLAYGMYMGGKKTGYIIEEAKLTTFQGKEVLAVRSHQYMVTIYDGEKSAREEQTVFHYELTGDGPMLHAKLVRTEDGKESTYEAVRHGKGMRIKAQLGKYRLHCDVTQPKDNLATARALEQWLSGERKAGEKFTKYSLCWEDEVDQPEVYIFEKKRTVTIDGKRKTVCKVDIDIHGGRLASDVFLDGRPYQGVMGGILEMKIEKEEEAKKVAGAPADLMAASCVSLDLDLSPARDVNELKLHVSKLGDFEIPASHRQLVTKEKDHVVLVTKRDFRLTKGTPLSDVDVKRYTADSLRFQCAHKAVRERAEKIVGTETDLKKKARQLEDWVYRELKKSYSDNADTSLEILDNKAGDCTEHALLYVALCRAVGVPAREVGGLAYIKSDDKPMMGWHAWAEIHDGHQWVSVDPTWDQVYVDGTHIKLSEGHRDLAWANIAGKVALKVQAVTRRR